MLTLLTPPDLQLTPQSFDAMQPRIFRPLCPHVPSITTVLSPGAVAPSGALLRRTVVGSTPLVGKGDLVLVAGFRRVSERLHHVVPETYADLLVHAAVYFVLDPSLP